jgi:hypothetical protein
MEQIKIEFNEKCAKFLGYKYTKNYQWYDESEFVWLDADGEWSELGIFYHDDDFSKSEHGYIRVDGKVLDNYHYDLDKFSKDWNWLMRVKNKICRMDVIDEFTIYYYCGSNSGYRYCLRPYYKDTFEGFTSDVFKTELEATIDVIDKFLDWYDVNR